MYAGVDKVDKTSAATGDFSKEIRLTLVFNTLGGEKRNRKFQRKGRPTSVELRRTWT